MIYPIVIYGSDVLRKPCERITPDYPEVKKLVEDMFLTLGEAEGVGLAAPQIGKNIRLFIVDCTPWGEDDPECADYKRAFINPEIYALSEEKKTYNEGCLSFPGIHADVPRSLAIRMRYMDEDFVEHDEEFTGLKAWVIQHEYDHIEGVVFTDRVAPLRRQLLKSKLVDMDLSVRALNCLKSAEVETLGDLVKYNKNDLLKFRNFGRKSLTELDELLANLNLSFGMDISNYKLDKD